MNRSVLRWILVALMAVSLLFTLSCPYAAEAEAAEEAVSAVPSLPLDITLGGSPMDPAGWVFDGANGKNAPTSYEDSTIRVTFQKSTLSHQLVSGNHKGKKVKDDTWIVRVRIGDVSQFRTAVAKDSMKKGAAGSIESIAFSKNAVVALNGDFFKYENDVGYVVRQGELIRDKSGNRRHYFDMLLVDSAGDFHVVYDAETKKIDEYVAENLTPLGRTILHTFNFGPVLVVNGEAQDVSVSGIAKQGLWQWSTPIARTAIVQTGPLEYAFVTFDGHGAQTSGCTMQEFADFIAENVPDAIIAYNMDGGGSAQLYAPKMPSEDKKTGLLTIRKGQKVFEGDGARELGDIVYFASALPAPEED